MILCVLIAFAVVVGMAAILPPSTTRAVRIDAVAVALRGPGDAILARSVVAVPPSANARWLEAPDAQRQLAAILRVPVADVRMVVTAPIRVRAVDPRFALADQPPARAGFLPLLQAENGASPAPTALPAPVVPPPTIVPAVPKPVVARPAPAPQVQAPAAERPRPRATAPRDATVRVPRAVPSPVAEAVGPAVVAAPVVPIVPQAAPVAPPIRAARPAAQPAPGAIQEVTGEFQAALRLPDRRWAVVRPRPEAFPTTTQQVMALWFLVALAISVTAAGLFAVLLVRPLRRFAAAAEASGRDPSHAVPVADTPDELAPAAAALARLQGRVQSLSGDRTAFAGMLRSDVRAPLDRLRARLDEAPRQVREAFYDDVAYLEDAVAGLQLFLTDAATPAALERAELGALVRATAAEAVARGDTVVSETDIVAWVDVDPGAIGRVLEQMIATSRRHGGAVMLVLGTDGDSATISARETALAADPVEATPPAGFAPGLHGKAERSAPPRPSGPSLAVARSIARAHGGEVLLVRSEDGMALVLRLPIAVRI
jgi:hypothetical protein